MTKQRAKSTTPEPERDVVFSPFPRESTHGQRRGFVILCLAVLLGVLALPLAVRSSVEARQSRLDESHVWDAIFALEDGDESRARREVDRVIATALTRRYEGNASTYYGKSYYQLAKTLFEHGWPDEGAAVAYKALRQFHRVRRPLEYLPPWFELQDQYFQDDPGRFFQVFKLINAHSRLSNNAFFRNVYELSRGTTPAAPGLTPLAPRTQRPAELMRYSQMRELRRTSSPERFMAILPQMRLPAVSPVMRVAHDKLIVEAMLEAGERDQAIELAEQLAELYPERLDALALASLAKRGQNAYQFTRTLKRSPNWAVFDMRTLKRSPTELGGGEPQFGVQHVSLNRNAAAQMEFDSPAELETIYLIASGSQVLGIDPVLLVTVDGGPEYPLLVDSSRPAVFPIHIPISAGNHTIRFELLNDARMKIKRTVYDRNVQLYRLVLARP